MNVNNSTSAEASRRVSSWRFSVFHNVGMESQQVHIMTIIVRVVTLVIPKLNELRSYLL